MKPIVSYWRRARDQRAAETMQELYGPLNVPAPSFYDSAELCSMRRIRFSQRESRHERDRQCMRAGRADVDQVRKALAIVVFFSGVVLRSCFPKDTEALLKSADDRGYDLDPARCRGREPQTEVATVRRWKVIKDLKGRTIAVWGLAFKRVRKICEAGHQNYRGAVDGRRDGPCIRS